MPPPFLLNLLFFHQEPKMESVHSLSFGTAVLRVLQSKSLPTGSHEENDQVKEKTLKQTCGDEAGPNNGSLGRYTLSKDRRESEILRTIDQENSNRQEEILILLTLFPPSHGMGL